MPSDMQVVTDLPRRTTTTWPHQRFRVGSWDRVVLATLFWRVTSKPPHWPPCSSRCFPLLFLFVGGVQTDLREALTWLSIALVATGIVSISFEFWMRSVAMRTSLRTSGGAGSSWTDLDQLRGITSRSRDLEGGIHLCSHLGLAVMGAIYLVLRKRYTAICLCLIPLLAVGIALTLSRLGLVAMLGGLLVLFGASGIGDCFRSSVLRPLWWQAPRFFDSFPDVLSKYVQTQPIGVYWRRLPRSTCRGLGPRFPEHALIHRSAVGIGTGGGKVEREAQILVPESTFLKFGVELGVVFNDCIHRRLSLCASERAVCCQANPLG